MGVHPFKSSWRRSFRTGVAFGPGNVMDKAETPKTAIQRNDFMMKIKRE